MRDESRIFKAQAILRVFAAGASLNRFEAEHHHDHCLHSTVATLQDSGINIDRRWEAVPCVHGRRTTRCKRYWLQQTRENLARVAELLDGAKGQT